MTTSPLSSSFSNWDNRIDNIIDELASKYNVDEKLLQELRDIRDEIPCNCWECQEEESK